MEQKTWARKFEEKRISQGLIILKFFLTVLGHLIWSHVRFNFTHGPIKSKTFSVLLWINFAISWIFLLVLCVGNLHSVQESGEIQLAKRPQVTRALSFWMDPCCVKNGSVVVSEFSSLLSPWSLSFCLCLWDEAAKDLTRWWCCILEHISSTSQINLYFL